ncbi:hypothetical protein CAC42_3370 [Sphaceloma murrayae]|uniref:Uncharacterized protein n=1 Tax=Sphaceloma murrayae TaxID=2082308 RepID=A0A2K1R1G4_9PEZI|nr:hypothetical protein CAC42_3370 [Sphaceloma murrayae]
MSTRSSATAGGDEDSDSGSRYSEDSLAALNDADRGASEYDNDGLYDDEEQVGDSASDDGIPEESESRAIAKRSVYIDSKDLKARRKVSRLRSRYRPQYRALFNSVIESAVDPIADDLEPLIDASDIGASHWTSAEKRVLFSRLPRTGRGDCRSLSESIGTKSEAEVRDYLNILLKGSVEDYLKSKRHFGITLDEVPAAFEVDAACEQELDIAAEKLAWKVELSDRKREKSRHGEYWLLDAAKASELEMLKQDDRPDDVTATPEHQESLPHQPPVPSASLLNLNSWLELAQVFMASSACAESSWVDLIESHDERPAIYNTAFADFHNLAISLTKRIVQATIFQAMSRLRATDRNAPEHVIRHQDVQAACKVMGLNSDWHTFWVHLPRRLRLQVYTRGKQAGPDKRANKVKILDYDTVESYLRSSATDEDPMQSARDQAMAISAVEDEEADSDMSYNSDLWTDVTVSDTDAAEQHATPADQSNDVDSVDEKPGPDSDVSSTEVSPYDRDKAETVYLEALDQQASKQEMQRLWSILKTKPVRDEPKEEDVAHPVPPARKRKRVEDIEDWRDAVEYRAEWQVLESVPAEEQFAAMGKRGRECRKRRLDKYARSIRAHEDA